MTPPRRRLVKLVRDRIAVVIGGDQAVRYDAIPTADLLPALRRKLIEEAVEYLEDPCKAELADVFEVVRCLASAEGWGMGRLVEEANAKAEERGTFIMGTGLYVETIASARHEEAART